MRTEDEVRRRGKVSTKTAKQDFVLRFIKAYLKLHGVPPSYEVIAIGLGLSAKSNAHRLVKELERKGELVTIPRKYMSIKIRDKSVKYVERL